MLSKDKSRVLCQLLHLLWSPIELGTICYLVSLFQTDYFEVSVLLEYGATFVGDQLLMFGNGIVASSSMVEMDLWAFDH